ncbi:MAG: hypothetical protein Q7S36_02890 [Candidatus Liptonbacteria bacterium]|nr:hypothetical protein [Candidatus Liptonbacteria bacterium]
MTRTKKELEGSPKTATPRKPKAHSNGNGNGNGISKHCEDLLKLLRREDHSFPRLSALFNVSSETISEWAAELSKIGYDVQSYTSNGQGYLTLARAEEIGQDSLPISLTNRKMKVAFISELRIGTHQSQISMAHWLYKEVFEQENVDFVVVAGGLTIGQPTPTLLPDIFKGDPKRPLVLADYAVKHFPKTDRFKTYVISNRREIVSKTKDGIDLLKLITQKRDDLAFAGDLERNFNVRGLRIKVLAPWDDNSPVGISYGPQKIVDNLSDDPQPHIIISGGTHKLWQLADYGENGAYVFGVASLHQQMIRQSRKGIRPRLGCLILELQFNEDWSFDLKKLKARLIKLDHYGRKSDCLIGVEDLDTGKLTKHSRKVLEWFVTEQSLTEGELSRRLNKSKLFVRKLMHGIEKRLKIKIPFSTHSKRYEFPKIEKTKFKPLPINAADIFRPLTKVGGLSCTHYGSEHDLPEVVRQAYEDAAKANVRRIFHAGDVTEGPGASGYRGHQNDVKFSDMDGLEDYTVAKWPRVKIKVDPKRPAVKTEMGINEKGQPVYKEVPVLTGETLLQTDIIDGNHDCWAKSMIGHRPVRTLALRMPELLRYLGPNDGKISMDGAVVFEGVYHRLTHGDGGLGYTISTKLQKHMASHRRRGVSIGKPTVLWFGNWHVNFVLFEDDLGLLLASFKSEDEFHLRKDLVSWVGMNIVELFGDDKGNLTQIISEYRNYRNLAVMNR